MPSAHSSSPNTLGSRWSWGLSRSPRLSSQPRDRFDGRPDTAPDFHRTTSVVLGGTVDALDDQHVGEFALGIKLQPKLLRQRGEDRGRAGIDRRSSRAVSYTHLTLPTS